jgi:alpha-tubulin suppressor-like RCC1 family protein
MANDLYGWGSNSSYGAVGNNSAANVSSPVMVMSSVDLFCTNGGSQNAALKSGNLYIWGRNTSGQLGLNSTINVSSPTMVGTANNWVFVNPGFNTGAIKSDGTLWMCGDNGSGSVGDGTVISRSSFVQIAGTWSKVRTETFFAPYHTVAIRSNGTLWGWGDNSIGQLGQNNLVNYSSPVQIGTANNYIDCAVACVGVAPPYNTNLTVALRSDGTLWVIGNGSYEGRTGTGVLTNYSSITQVGTSTDWASISCTTNFVAAVKKDGTLWNRLGTSSSQLL